MKISEILFTSDDFTLHAGVVIYTTFNYVETVMVLVFVELSVAFKTEIMNILNQRSTCTRIPKSK